MRIQTSVLIVAFGVLWGTGPHAAPALDYSYFKSKVQPVFLKKRAEHTRCVVCHADATNALKLVQPAAGSNAWNEEQSRQNFETVSKLVTPGDPEHSRLLMHPLAPEAGGSAFHSGGRQFRSMDDPDWKAFAQWVMGATEPGK
jgi:hypothetical protein